MTRNLEISSQMGKAFVGRYLEEGLVCPRALRKRMLTTAAIETIDRNPSSEKAQSSFHGTSIINIPTPNQK